MLAEKYAQGVGGAPAPYTKRLAPAPVIKKKPRRTYSYTLSEREINLLKKGKVSKVLDFWKKRSILSPRGIEVAKFQAVYNWLIKNKYIKGKKLTVDGINGRHTREAVNHLQKQILDLCDKKDSKFGKRIRGEVNANLQSPFASKSFVNDWKKQEIIALDKKLGQQTVRAMDVLVDFKNKQEAVPVMSRVEKKEAKKAEEKKKDGKEEKRIAGGHQGGAQAVADEPKEEEPRKKKKTVYSSDEAINLEQIIRQSKKGTEKKKKEKKAVKTDEIESIVLTGSTYLIFIHGQEISLDRAAILTDGKVDRDKLSKFLTDSEHTLIFDKGEVDAVMRRVKVLEGKRAVKLRAREARRTKSFSAVEIERRKRRGITREGEKEKQRAAEEERKKTQQLEKKKQEAEKGQKKAEQKTQQARIDILPQKSRRRAERINIGALELEKLERKPNSDGSIVYIVHTLDGEEIKIKRNDILADKKLNKNRFKKVIGERFTEEASDAIFERISQIEPSEVQKDRNKKKEEKPALSPEDLL